MDENKVLELLKHHLAQINYNYEILTPTQKKHLLEIEIETSRRLREQEKALTSIKNNKINIATISSAINIARKTVYNNVMLKDYIEYTADLYNANYPTSGQSELKEQIIEYKGIIEKMVRRDSNIEDLKGEIDELHKEIGIYKEEINKLTEVNIDLTVQVRSYEKKLKVKSSLNIVK